jgi:hypothetical protein
MSLPLALEHLSPSCQYNNNNNNNNKLPNLYNTVKDKGKAVPLQA